MTHEEMIDHEALFPVIHNDDVLQEAALHAILHDGETPHRGLIRKRLANQQPELLINTGVDHQGAISVLKSDPLTSEHTMLEILNWAETQPKYVQQTIHEFLNGDIPLEEVLNILTLFDVSTEKPAKPKKPNMTDLIRRELEKGPRTKEQLYDLAKSQSSSKNPHAAVRQILRRLTLSWEIVEEDNAYRLST